MSKTRPEWKNIPYVFVKDKWTGQVVEYRYGVPSGMISADGFTDLMNLRALRRIADGVWEGDKAKVNHWYKAKRNHRRTFSQRWQFDRMGDDE